MIEFYIMEVSIYLMEKTCSARESFRKLMYTIREGLNFKFNRNFCLIFPIDRINEIYLLIVYFPYNMNHNNQIMM
jgi:hypothetical protein